MNTTSIRARTLACALLATTAYCGLTVPPAAAQTARQHRALDANGVDLTYGDFVMAFVEGSIGSGKAELTLVRNRVGILGSDNGHAWDRITFQQSPLSGGGTRYFVTNGARYEQFDGTGTLPTGSSLSGSGASFTYRTPDGAAIVFSNPVEGWAGTSPYCDGSQTSCSLLPSSITSPDGKTVDLNWDIWTYCWGEITIEEVPCSYEVRISKVSNSFGYETRFAYASDGTGGGQAPQSWFRRTGATFHNNTVSGNPSQGSVGYSYPSGGVTEVTDMNGRVWRFTGDTTKITSVRRPGASSDTTSISYGTGNVVTSIARDGVTTNYSRSVSGNTGTMTVTNALSQTSTVVSDLTIGRPTSVTDALSRTTSYQYDSNGRLTRVTAPEGDYVQYTLDGRGNVTQAQAVPKSGSGLGAITTSASYDSTCSNPVTCNRPSSITDARNEVTEFTYDSTHGGVLTVTAPTSGAVRPQTRYSYTLINGEYQVTEISACQTSSTCAGGADEVKATLAYDANGNVTSTTAGDGSGTLTATTAMTYDALGNLLTVDGPLSGTADTMRYRYDAGRARIGEISADPDGGGSLKHRAVRTTINNEGLPTKIERGTVNSQSDADWAAFSSLEAVETVYDSNARPTISKLTSGSTIYALTHSSYDALGRPECAAQRLNPAAFSSLPSSACSLGTQGSHGPDRITKTIYDAAGQVTQVKTALGVTGEEANEITSTYTSNGRAQTVTDAEGNKTTYEYDGHDRLAKTRFPDTTKGAGTSSTSDYEQLTYDASSNVTSRRLRDGNSIGLSYDALGRLTSKDLPGSEPDVSYTYDALGRMTGASQTGNSLSFTYDALGRNLTQVGPQGTVTSAWDIAGRRTRITHPDSFYVDQDYLVTGEMSAIRENGATSGIGVLATFAYDDLGRRTSLTRGNGSSTTYSYDPVSRLASIAHDMAGTTHDVTLGFSYNPASQIVQNTRSNDLYAWAGHGTGTTASTANGLNEIVSHGGVTLTHDAKGNLTYDSTSGKTFGYSSENLLTSANGGRWLKYDPLMRLYESGISASTRIAYDGHSRIAEYDQLNTQVARFVFGPGIDEPLVVYEGTDLGTRRFLHADERGSIIALSDTSGNVTGVNTFDEYGRLGAGNTGRFHFAGQPYETVSDQYYSRARMYNPRLGRFMQTDPIGYGGGMNLYAYVGGDPINSTDPSGTTTCTGSRIRSSCGGGGLGTGLSGFSTAAVGGRADLKLPYDLTGFLDDDIVTYSEPKLSYDFTGLLNGTGVTYTDRNFAGPSFALYLAGAPQGGLGTPKNYIQTPPQFFSHVEAGHFGFDDRFKSKFDSKFQNQVSIFRLAQFAANNSSMRPGDFPGTFIYTARYSGVVGYLRGTGDPTNFVSLVVLRLGTFDRLGRPEYRAVTMYPGF